MFFVQFLSTSSSSLEIGVPARVFFRNFALAFGFEGIEVGAVFEAGDFWRMWGNHCFILERFPVETLEFFFKDCRAQPYVF